MNFLIYKKLHIEVENLRRKNSYYYKVIKYEISDLKELLKVPPPFLFFLCVCVCVCAIFLKRKTVFDFSEHFLRVYRKLVWKSIIQILRMLLCKINGNQDHLWLLFSNWIFIVTDLMIWHKFLKINSIYII